MSPGTHVLRQHANVVHVELVTTAFVTRVSLYGQDVGSYSDERLISIAKEELKRKLNSPVFCLVDVRSNQPNLDFGPLSDTWSTH